MIEQKKPLRVAFSGCPGAGKTTCARAVAGAARKVEGIKTVELVDEYARQYIHKYGIDGVVDQMRIFNKQLTEESKFPNTTDLIITDSPVFLGFFYALELRKEGNTKDTMYINDLFKDLNKLNETPYYDIVFHIPPVLKPVKDNIRLDHHFDDNWREEKNKSLYVLFSTIFPPKKLVVLSSITVEDRVKEALKVIKEYRDGSSQ